jgi:hypothetical protein
MTIKIEKPEQFGYAVGRIHEIVAAIASIYGQKPAYIEANSLRVQELLKNLDPYLDFLRKQCEWVWLDSSDDDDSSDGTGS